MYKNRVSCIYERKQQVKRMCTQWYEWGAILSWGSNLENRKQDASEFAFLLPQTSAK